VDEMSEWTKEVISQLRGHIADAQECGKFIHADLDSPVRVIWDLASFMPQALDEIERMQGLLTSKAILDLNNRAERAESSLAAWKEIAGKLAERYIEDGCRNEYCHFCGHFFYGEDEKHYDYCPITAYRALLNEERKDE